MSDLLIKMPLNYEPLRKNRWLFRFPADLGIQEWWLSSASRPSINQKETEIPFLNTSTWVVGRYTWDTIQITLRDPIGPSASQAVMEWIRLHSESVTRKTTDMRLVISVMLSLKCLIQLVLLFLSGFLKIPCVQLQTSVIWITIQMTLLPYKLPYVSTMQYYVINRLIYR